VDHVNPRKFAYWLLTLGGLNWGLYAFGLDVESWGLPLGDVVFQILYVLVGLSAVWYLFKKGPA
jgi:uncharacterized membrane protein YuzA (DUF378 family)